MGGLIHYLLKKGGRGHVTELWAVLPEHIRCFADYAHTATESQEEEMRPTNRQTSANQVAPTVICSRAPG